MSAICGTAYLVVTATAYCLLFYVISKKRLFTE